MNISYSIYKEYIDLCEYEGYYWIPEILCSQFTDRDLDMIQARKWLRDKVKHIQEYELQAFNNSLPIVQNYVRKIYVDGGFKLRSKKSAYGLWDKSLNVKKYGRTGKCETNNHAEAKAIEEGIKYCLQVQKEYLFPLCFVVYSDSKAVVNQWSTGEFKEYSERLLQYYNWRGNILLRWRSRYDAGITKADELCERAF